MRNFRSGFSMLVAIFVIVLLSLVASYIFYASSSISKEGAIQYQQEEARVLARSYTEYAVLAVSGNQKSGGICINEIHANIGNPNIGQGYRVTVYITYIGNTRYVNNCRNVAATLANTDVDALSIIVDVYVEYRDIMHPSLNSSFVSQIPWQVYHRRSIQKI